MTMLCVYSTDRSLQCLGSVYTVNTEAFTDLVMCIQYRNALAMKQIQNIFFRTSTKFGYIDF